jgi:hypothetical protein
MKKLNKNQSYSVHQKKDYALVINTLNIDLKNFINSQKQGNQQQRKTFWKMEKN